MSTGADDVGVETLERQLFSRSRFDVPAKGADRLIGEKPSRRHAVDTERRTVVDEGADRKLRGDSRDAADVIGMVVGHEQVIETLEARLPGDREDPLGVTAVARVAGINQERLPVGREEERRLAALDVDEIDLERPGGGTAATTATPHGNQERDWEDEAFHDTILVRRPHREFRRLDPFDPAITVTVTLTILAPEPGQRSPPDLEPTRSIAVVDSLRAR